MAPRFSLEVQEFVEPTSCLFYDSFRVLVEVARILLV